MKLLIVSILSFYWVVNINIEHAADPFHPDNWQGSGSSFSFWEWLIWIILLFIAFGIVALIQSLIKKHFNVEIDDGSFDSTGGCFTTLLGIVIAGVLFGIVYYYFM